MPLLRRRLPHPENTPPTPVVDFLIGGTQKGGTSALFDFLRQHPTVATPSKVKEVHFFDDDYWFQAGDLRAAYEHYHGHFDQAGGPEAPRQITGEATPIYMWWDPAMRRIWEYNPEIKLIFLLRDPAERAYSQWNMEVQRGHEHLDFEQALIQERERCRAYLPAQSVYFAYRDRGFYSAQLRRVLRFFPREQVLLLRMEDLRSNHAGTLRKVCAFLEIDADIAIPGREVHARSYDEDRPETVINRLREDFANEIAELEHMTGWDLADWRYPSSSTSSRSS